MLRLATLGLAFALGLSGATAASATTFSFHCISGDGGGACAIPVEELSLEVTDVGGGEISFTFHNDNGDSSSIVSIYFDDDLDLLGDPQLQIERCSGVDYAEGGSPGNLPSGNVEDFHADRVFSAANPKKGSGVAPGESVTIRFTASFADVVEALESGELRVGLHAPGFGSHGNKSFVNDVHGVPEPGLLALLALGAGALARRR